MATPIRMPALAQTAFYLVAGLAWIWILPLRRILTAPGITESAPTDAEVTLTLSVLRGLLLDLLATGEAERVDLAWRRFVLLSWPSTPRTY